MTLTFRTMGLIAAGMLTGFDVSVSLFFGSVATGSSTTGLLSAGAGLVTASADRSPKLFLSKLIESISSASNESSLRRLVPSPIAIVNFPPVNAVMRPLMILPSFSLIVSAKTETQNKITTDNETKLRVQKRRVVMAVPQKIFQTIKVYRVYFYPERMHSGQFTFAAFCGGVNFIIHLHARK